MAPGGVYQTSAQGAKAMQNEANYPSDLTENQWQVIREILPTPGRLGRKPIDRKSISNAILYWCGTGYQWRYLPKEFPKWSTVYGVFRKWTLEGVWTKIHDVLREMVRKAAGKEKTFSVAVIDSQSVKTAEGVEMHGQSPQQEVERIYREICRLRDVKYYLIYHVLLDSTLEDRCHAQPKSVPRCLHVLACEFGSLAGPNREQLA